MTRYLLATDSVNVSAAACDYVDGRVGSDDEVIAAAVTGSGLGPRDASDALNVARVRLALPEVKTIEREGDPPVELLAIAREREVEAILVGSPASGTGEVLSELLASAERPVVVVPVGVAETG